MKPAICQRRTYTSCFWLGLVMLLCVATSASAQSPVHPTSRSNIQRKPVSFDEAQAALGKAPLRAALTVSALPQASTTPIEILQLARALKNDPDLIYQYVHDNIEFTPLFGVLKGPWGTLLDQRGNSFDQAALMVALLTQASLTNPAISNVLFEFGQIHLTSAQLQSWLGIDNDLGSLEQVLGSGGIPGTVYTDGSADVGHVWIRVNINGTPYVFDPAFKAHNFSAGIVSSLPNIMGYSQSSFLSNAGGTVSSTTIQGVNRTQLRNDLATYAANLASYIRTNAPTGGVKDIVGGGTIVPTPVVNGQTIRQTSNPNQMGAPTDWATIPATYHATLAVTLPGAATQTFNSDDIYGHRLSIFFDTSFVPTLYLDGTAAVSGSAFSQGSQLGVDFDITIPWATFANQSHTQYINAETNQNGGSGGYVVQTGWDQVGRGMVEKHRTLLNQAINSGAPANSEVVLGETLAMLGYTWLGEVAQQQRLSDQLLGTVTQYFYGGGIVGEAVGSTIASPYVDLPLNFTNTPPRLNGSTTGAAASQSAFLDSSGGSSSFESTTLEQTQANVPGFVAASTIKLLDTGVQNGDTIFDINNGNTAATQEYYSNTIRPQLAPNYDPGDLATIDSYVGQGFRVIAPLHGQIPIGAWTGVGFKTLYSNAGASSYGEIISGGLSGASRRIYGGFGGSNDGPGSASGNTAGSQQQGSNSPGSNSPGSSGNVGDPVEHRKGSLQYRNNDLSVGAKSFPYGLSFERSYDSGAQNISGPLGKGWTHNFAINAAAGSDGFTGMGDGSPLNAVSSIVALYVSSDLMKGQALSGEANLENFVVETVVNRWFTDHLTQNVVYVTQGRNSEEFIKMADGSYSPPVGSATILDAPGGAFRYRTKAGLTMSFNSTGQISSSNIAAGASVNFSYSGGLLSSVSNSATGRQLSLTYSGNLISAVSDGSRTVQYSYTNGDLTAFADALSQRTTFAYDASGAEDSAGHLTQVYYPSNPKNAFVTTYYDALGKVAQQKDANGNLTQTFFAGTRSEIDDPLGNRHVWYVDPRGNILSEIQDYGDSTHLNVTRTNTYDGQNNSATSTLPEANSVSYTYDALFNPLTITKHPKPGAPLSATVQSFTYVVPVSSLPNFEEVQSSKDPNGNVTNFAYNTSTGTLSTMTQAQVSKPGIGMSTPTESFTYTGIGLLQTSQDAEDRVTRFDYDPVFADQLAKRTIDYGRLNLITQYGYDSYGDVSTVIDANGNKTMNSFDKLRRLTETDGAISGVVTKYTYFPDGVVSTAARQASAGVFETTTYTYTLSDKVSVVTDPLANTVTTTYDRGDRRATVTTQVSATQNRQRTFSYDTLSRLHQISDTSSGSPGTPLESHTYTPNGNQAAFADGKNHKTTYTYDGLDRLSQVTYPDTGTEKYQYDPYGNVLQKTTRSGETITFTYDALNRASTKTPMAEVAGKVTYGYDLSGRVLQALDASSSDPYQIAYDTAGRANSYTDQQGRNTQVQYDAVGNRVKVQWPANTNGSSAYYVTYAVDALNRIAEIDANGSTSTPLAKCQWDPLSRLSLITYGDGTTDSYSKYDAADNLQTLTQNFNGGSNVTFTYGWFKNHQKQSTALNNGAFQYIPTTGSVTYDPADVDNGYSTVGTASLTYDGNRNLTYDGLNTLIYDVENRLVESQNASFGTIQYLYDPLGHRKQKLVSGVTTQFVLVGNEEIADFKGTGVGNAAMLTVPGVGGLPLAAITPSTGTVTYYHHDVLGSTTAVTQVGTAGAADVYTYGEYGAPGAGNSAAYRFAGYRYDPETLLYYVNARYYSPRLGRFLQTDPIGYAGGRNLYAYAKNDPINRIDPLGTCDNPQGCVVFAAAGMIFPNQLPGNLAAELEAMEELGITGIVPGTPEFAALAEASETIIWVAPEGGGILVAPLTEGLTHAALANGVDVLGAGTAELTVGADGIAVVFDVTALSGHYLGPLATEEASTVAIEAGIAGFEEWELLGLLLLL